MGTLLPRCLGTEKHSATRLLQSIPSFLPVGTQTVRTKLQWLLTTAQCVPMSGKLWEPGHPATQLLASGYPWVRFAPGVSPVAVKAVPIGTNFQT